MKLLGGDIYRRYGNNRTHLGGMIISLMIANGVCLISSLRKTKKNSSTVTMLISTQNMPTVVLCLCIAVFFIELSTPFLANNLVVNL